MRKPVRQLTRKPGRQLCASQCADPCAAACAAAGALLRGRLAAIAGPQVWKDVDGVLSADPRVVAGAVPVPFLTYEEATELAYFGAQV